MSNNQLHGPYCKVLNEMLGRTLTLRMFLRAHKGATMQITKMTIKMRPLPFTMGPVTFGLK